MVGAADGGVDVAVHLHRVTVRQQVGDGHPDVLVGAAA
jgi:hypothetical protein